MQRDADACSHAVRWLSALLYNSARSADSLLNYSARSADSLFYNSTRYADSLFLVIVKLLECELILHPPSDKPNLIPAFKSFKTFKKWLKCERTSIHTTKFWARFGPRKSYCTRWMRKKHVIFLILDCNATEPLKDHRRLSDLREQCDFQMCFEVA